MAVRIALVCLPQISVGIDLHDTEVGIPMGMGTDGHTASWFPGSAELGAALDAQAAYSVIAARAPQAAGAAERLTLTLPALARAERVLLLISGDEKRARLEQATRDDDAPVAALFKPPLNADVLWAP